MGDFKQVAIACDCSPNSPVWRDNTGKLSELSISTAVAKIRIPPKNRKD